MWVCNSKVSLELYAKFKLPIQVPKIPILSFNYQIPFWRFYVFPFFRVFAFTIGVNNNSCITVSLLNMNSSSVWILSGAVSAVSCWQCWIKFSHSEFASLLREKVCYCVFFEVCSKKVFFFKIHMHSFHNTKIIRKESNRTCWIGWQMLNWLNCLNWLNWLNAYFQYLNIQLM